MLAAAPPVIDPSDPAAVVELKRQLQFAYLKIQLLEERLRLERGCFRWPVAEAGQTKIVLSHEEMALLVGGIDLAGSRRRAWFRKIVGEDAQPAKCAAE